MSIRLYPQAPPPLNQGYGYGIVIGFGAFFSFFITAVLWVQRKFGGVDGSSEEFSTAGRSVKIGLLASSVVSAWTWAATLLQSSSVAYTYGVSGPYWYAAGATIQILLFAIIAIEVKRKAPKAHTFPEIIKARYGRNAHIVFLCFGLITNAIVTSMLLLGGASVVNALTGMNIYAACFLTPLGTILYVVFGGLRATFLTDYVHTVVLYILILVFAFKTYSTYPGALIGSPEQMYNLLQNAVNRIFVALCVPTVADQCDADNNAWSRLYQTLTTTQQQQSGIGWIQGQGLGGVTGNAGYSYMTMASKNGLIFGVINIVGNFGTVFCDQAYWQRAVAARPASTVHGYIIGGLCWFFIPFFLATTLGLATIALEADASFPTYPFPLDPSDVGAGLVAPAAAVALMGSSGACAILILVFLAVTSSLSAELIAVASLITYDVYNEYINPKALGADIIRVQHITTVCFGIFMGALASVLNNFGITLGYLYLLMGIIVAPAVVPIAFTLTWSKQSATGAITAAIVGFFLGLTTWLATARGLYGVVNVTTTGQNLPMLAGNLVSLLSPFFITVPISLMKPDNFHWEEMKDKIQFTSDEIEYGEKVSYDKELEENPEALSRALRFAYGCAWTLTAVLIFLFPLPMLGQRYVFTWQFFSGWVAVGFIGTFLASLTVIFLPIYESFAGMRAIRKQAGMASMGHGGQTVRLRMTWEDRMWNRSKRIQRQILKSLRMAKADVASAPESIMSQNDDEMEETVSKKQTEKVFDRPLEISVEHNGKAVNGSVGTTPQVAKVTGSIANTSANQRPPAANKNGIISPSSSSLHMSHLLLQSQSPSVNASANVSRNNSDEDLLRKR